MSTAAVMAATGSANAASAPDATSATITFPGYWDFLVLTHTGEIYADTHNFDQG